MRILHFIWGFKVGGAEILLVDILQEQMKNDDITLMIGNAVASDSLLETIPNGVRVVALKRPEGSRNPLYLFKLRRELTICRPDIIHTHNDSLIRLLPFVGTPKVLTVHETGIPLSGRLADYDRVFCVSEAVRKDVAARFPASNPGVVYNGICASRFRQRENTGLDRFRIVQIGRLDHEIKGQDILIRSVQAVRNQFGIESIALDFIGEGQSRGYLEKLVNECGLAGCCRFLGLKSREYLYENLKNYDLLVQPSRIEGFGLTIAEAMAAKVPVLVANIDGPLEVIGWGDFGFVFESGNHHDCARQIAGVASGLRTGEVLEVVARAHTHVTRYFDVERTAVTYRAEYLNLLSQVTVPGNRVGSR